MAEREGWQQESTAPHIGVLCIDVAKHLLDIYPSAGIRAYIAASYVKFLEGAGAEVVPVWIGRDRTYYEDILKKLNGLLIPGGAVNFSKKSDCDLPNDCVQASKFIYDIGKQLNDKGIYFPIWGTCLGFQLIMYHAANHTDEVRVNCQHMDCSIPICFEMGFRNSKMFRNLPETLRASMETQPFGCHYHKFCITEEALARCSIEKEWRILATNQDDKGLKFITLAEHVSYPFYGSQIHLERIAYEIIDETDPCAHASSCIEAAQYYADFLVSECRKCPNHFENNSERLRHLIKNFELKSTINHPNTHWIECYMFGASPDYPNEMVH